MAHARISLSGALADLLLVDGNPTVNLELIADPEKTSLVTVQTAVFPPAFVFITIFQAPGFSAVLSTMSASVR